jgi:hypothetical protein
MNTSDFNIIHLLGKVMPYIIFIAYLSYPIAYVILCFDDYKIRRITNSQLIYNIFEALIVPFTIIFIGFFGSIFIGVVFRGWQYAMTIF